MNNTSKVISIRGDQDRLQLMTSDAPTWAQIVHSAIKRADTPMHADAFKMFLPYCLHRTENEDVRCVINRSYHAVGHSTFTDYEAATGWHITTSRMLELEKAGIVDAKGYLFNDVTSPRRNGKCLRSYRAKVDALLAPYIGAAKS